MAAYQWGNAMQSIRQFRVYVDPCEVYTGVKIKKRRIATRRRISEVTQQTRRCVRTCAQGWELVWMVWFGPRVESEPGLGSLQSILPCGRETRLLRAAVSGARSDRILSPANPSFLHRGKAGTFCSTVGLCTIPDIQPDQSLFLYLRSRVIAEVSFRCSFRCRGPVSRVL